MQLGIGIIMSVIMLSGCGGSGNGKMASDTMAAYPGANSVNSEVKSDIIYEMGVLTESQDKKESVQMGERKLIKTVNMDVETEEFDGLIAKLRERVGELKGYIESSNIRGNIRYQESRNAAITIRVPSGELENFVNEVAEISNIVRKSENVSDITLTYVDVESRKKALEIEQERLHNLLEKAESVEDIITIEGRLSEVRYELQSYASQLLVYDNQVDYSTIHLNISEVKRLTPQEEPSILERITEGFSDNLSAATKMLVDLFIGIIILSPYWGLWVLIVLAIVFFCKGISTIQKKKYMAKKQEIENRKKEEK